MCNTVTREMKVLQGAGIQVHLTAPTC